MSKFEIPNQHQKFENYMVALNNFEVQFVINNILPYFFLFSSYVPDEKVQC